MTGPGIRAREQAWQERRPLPTLKQIPPDVISLFDYEPLARERLSEQAWVYLSSGAGDGVSLADNRRAFEALRLVPRVLTDIRNVTTEIELLGLRLSHPVLFAPVGYQKLFHPDGERASAAAAAATETLLTVSTEASVALEEIAAAGEGAPQWFQLYFQADRGFTRALVERAKAAGYRAIVVTVDAPLSGLRNAEQRVRLKLPPGVEAVNLRSAGTRADVASLPPFHAAIATAPTWDEVGRLIRDAGLPVLLKGILSPADAVTAVEIGAAGLIVSNHGGRVLDTAAAPLEALPRVADAVAGRVPLVLDGGVRRGTDVIKALARGARAVAIGRPYVMGLAAAGALGAAHVVKLLCEEIALAMALLGISDLGEVPAQTIFEPRPR